MVGISIVSMPQETIIRLTNQMLGTPDDDREINEMDQSAAIEIGNIMISAFLDATAELLEIVMVAIPPGAGHRYGTCRLRVHHSADGRRRELMY